MAKKDNFKATVRNALIANSNIRPAGIQTAEVIRTSDPAISRTLAIEARRKELRK